jgi:hypothetical protein
VTTNATRSDGGRGFPDAAPLPGRGGVCVGSSVADATG